LTVNAVADKADITLFAYAISNSGDIRLSLKNNTFGLDQWLSGRRHEPHAARWTATRARRTAANGQASLGSPAGLYPDVSVGGVASLTARSRVPSTHSSLTGLPTSRTGIYTWRYHGFERINGPIVMSRAAFRRSTARSHG
jgi:hypothetical protein